MNRRSFLQALAGVPVALQVAALSNNEPEVKSEVPPPIKMEEIINRHRLAYRSIKKGDLISEVPGVPSYVEPSQKGRAVGVALNEAAKGDIVLVQFVGAFGVSHMANSGPIKIV